MTAPATSIGIVAIGRNEGDRLHRCLTSVVGGGLPLVYVDSGSSDGSVELARSFGAAVVELAMDIPFTAARARNAGLRKLLELAPNLTYVQFIDGDCEVVPTWLGEALAALESRSDLAAVWGRRRERHPDRSLYNRLCDLEWACEPGETAAFGGDVLVRVEALRSVEGYDDSVAAGEERELCLRLRHRGWRIYCTGNEMTIHDAAISRFSQWWRRSVRGGYGAINVAVRHAHKGERIYTKQIRSALTWAIFWPTLISLVALVSFYLGWTFSSLLALIVVASIGLLQVLRLSVRAHRRGSSVREAIIVGVFAMISKFAQARGMISWFCDNLRNRRPRTIEYKNALS